MTDTNATSTDTSCEANNGRADFQVYLATTSHDLSGSRVTANIQLSEQQFAANRFRRAIRRDEMPTFETGGLIVIASAGKFSHIGTVTCDLEDPVAPSFEIFATPVKELNTPIHLAHQVGKNKPYAYTFVAITAAENFYGNIRRLNRQEADRIRKLIGPCVQPPYRNIYWNQAERLMIDADLAQIKADEAETLRFQKNVALMIAEMERLNAAA